MYYRGGKKSSHRPMKMPKRGSKPPAVPKTLAKLEDMLNTYLLINPYYQGSLSTADDKSAFIFADKDILERLHTENIKYIDTCDQVSLSLLI